MLDYLASYADTFKLRSHIQFGTRVMMCLPLADGRWEVELAGVENESTGALSFVTDTTGISGTRTTPAVSPVSTST